MKRSPIQEHTSAIIEGFIEETNSLRNLDQKQLKGKLREKFVTEILAKFLTSQFGIGTGIIVNQKGEEQTNRYNHL